MVEGTSRMEMNILAFNTKYIHFLSSTSFYYIPIYLAENNELQKKKKEFGLYNWVSKL